MYAITMQRMVLAIRAATDRRVAIAGSAGVLPALPAAHRCDRYPGGNMA
jgi:hypothetical protein